MKTCSKCGESKPPIAYYADGANADGLRSNCKTCCAVYMAAYRQRIRRDPTTWARDALSGIKYRCKERGIPFGITAADLAIPDVCPIRLTPFVFGEVGHPDSPSVDRRIPALGYVRGNVSVISHRANMMKSDCADAATFRRMADWLEAGNALNVAQAQAFIEAVMTP